MRPANIFPRLLLQLVLFPDFSRSQPSPHVFTKYIGAKFNASTSPTSLSTLASTSSSSSLSPSTTIPPPPRVPRTDGNFNAYWDSSNLGPSDVSAIKSQFPNVRVAMSLGGATVGGQPAYFSPSDVDSWVSSLTSIIQQYDLDGLDIDYECFASSGDPDTFSSCISQLVTTLKNNGVISFESIVPFNDSDVQSHYQYLWGNYGSTTESQFLDNYNTQQGNYPGGTVLVSMNTASDAGGLSPANGFFDVCSNLQNQGMLNGIFIWSEDDSLANGFQDETQAQYPC
ncbi:hypothetical protein MLD38_005818 [Melastoma candidum]|uniref:Uncharacterized protein n=1 Tax=Melastoma candidum TaxID=119954 RepID=A0ACB9RUB8_9MYRT|nr:hypothetical protein MLD38_005818 [Melastoma candidum]